MKYIFFLITIICCSMLHGQNNPDHKRTMHWYFGNKAGLDFSSGKPVADTTGKMNVQQGNAAISDTSGQLLFYTDGHTIWNRFHQIMPNGTDIGIGQYSTPEDCAVIIPKPGDNTIYYIFLVDGWENNFKKGMNYCEVDMKQDNGNGVVIKKNMQLFKSSTEQLAATKDSSGCGYWVVGHEFSTANFRAYHVTSAGVDTVAVISAAGTDYSIPLQFYYLGGGNSLKFTPNGLMAGSLISLAYPATHLSDYIDVLKFNKNNGQFSSIVSIPIDTMVNGTFGFSPNSKYLYYEGGWHLAKDWQYDISLNDSVQILSSKTLVFSSGSNLGIAQDWQIGYDGKIYTSAEAVGNYLSIVNSPDLKGINCDIKRNSFSLNGRTPAVCLPRFVTNFLVNDTSSICLETGIIENSKENKLLIYPNPANEMIFINTDIIIKQIRITNIWSKTIFEDEYFRGKSEINCQSFNSGIYVLQITTLNNKFLSTKLIINH